MFVILKDKPAEAVRSAGMYMNLISGVKYFTSSKVEELSHSHLWLKCVSAMMDKTDPTHTHTDTHRHKCRVEVLMMAVTDPQLGLVPKLLWEMTLFGPIKVRLCTDTSIHMIITLWGIPSLRFSVYSLFLKLLWGHTQTHNNWPISCCLKSTFFMFEVSWISCCQPGKPSQPK